MAPDGMIGKFYKIGSFWSLCFKAIRNFWVFQEFFENNVINKHKMELAFVWFLRRRKLIELWFSANQSDFLIIQNHGQGSCWEIKGGPSVHYLWLSANLPRPLGCSCFFCGIDSCNVSYKKWNIKRYWSQISDAINF